jgi:hypothetical protein
VTVDLDHAGQDLRLMLIPGSIAGRCFSPVLDSLLRLYAKDHRVLMGDPAVRFKPICVPLEKNGGVHELLGRNMRSRCSNINGRSLKARAVELPCGFLSKSDIVCENSGEQNQTEISDKSEENWA